MGHSDGGGVGPDGEKRPVTDGKLAAETGQQVDPQDRDGQGTDHGQAIGGVALCDERQHHRRDQEQGNCRPPPRWGYGAQVMIRAHRIFLRITQGLSS